MQLSYETEKIKLFIKMRYSVIVAHVLNRILPIEREEERKRLWKILGVVFGELCKEIGRISTVGAFVSFFKKCDELFIERMVARDGLRQQNTDRSVYEEYIALGHARWLSDTLVEHFSLDLARQFHSEFALDSA